jgi:Condensation domain
VTAPTEGSRPVSPGSGQEWVFYREDVEGRQDTLQFSVNLPETASERAVQDALRQVAVAHEAFRTTIETRGAARTLTVQPPGRALAVVDWSTCRTASPAPGELDQWHDGLLGEPLDLARGAVRCVLAVTPTERRLVFAVHHAMCDGVAVNIVIRDFLNALCGMSLAPGRRQPSDHALGRDLRLEQRNLTRWLGTLAGAPTSVTYAPARIIRQPDHGDKVVEFRLTREVTSRLQHVARRSRATFFGLWLTMVHVWASQYAGEHDLILSMMTANRGRRDDRDIVANISLPLWLRLNGQPGDTFASRLAVVQRALLERLSWTAYSPVAVFEALSGDARQRGSSFRPAVNTSLHLFGGPRLLHRAAAARHDVRHSALAAPVTVISTSDVPEASWSDLRTEGVVRGGELWFWLFVGQAVWRRRPPVQLAEDLLGVVTLVSHGNLDLPVAEAAMPCLGAGLARDERSGSRVDLALARSVLEGLPGVTSASVTGPGDQVGQPEPGITARVAVDPLSPAGQEPGWLEREMRRCVPDCRGVVVPAAWRIDGHQ